MRSSFVIYLEHLVHFIKNQPWLPATAPAVVNKLTSSKTQWTLCINENVFVGLFSAYCLNNLWSTNGSNTYNTKVKIIHTKVMA